MHGTKTKTFQYRYVEGLKNGRSLQQLLQALLYESHRMIAARAEPVQGDDPSEQVRRCINHKVTQSNMLFGELILYVRGTNKQVVTVDENQEELPMAQIRAPHTDSGEPREFIEGTVYFGLAGNHMVVVQSLALRDRDLESHLAWLLRQKAEVLSEGEMVVLRKELSLDGKEALPEVRKVKIGAPLLYADRNRTSGGSDASVRVNISDLGREFIKALVGEDQLQALNLEQYSEAENLEVVLEIRRKGGKRGPGTDADQAISALTTHLRHTHEEDITVFTKEGKVSGTTLYLAERRSVDCWNGLPQRHSLFEAMYQWLTEKLESGAIQP